MVLATEGTSRIYLGSWSNIILATPEQLRMASEDELSVVENMTDMLKALGEDFRSSQQIGYVDERGPGPPQTVVDGALAGLDRRDSSEQPAVDEPASAASLPVTPDLRPPHQRQGGPPASSTSAAEPTPVQPQADAEMDTVPDEVRHMQEQMQRVAAGEAEPAGDATKRISSVATDPSTEPRSVKARLTFFAKRIRIEAQSAHDHKKKTKGHEVNVTKLAPHLHDKFVAADAKELRKHVEHDVFTVRFDLNAFDLKKAGKNVLKLRPVRVDKNEETTLHYRSRLGQGL